MSRRERLFAAALAVCFGLITCGVTLIYLPAGLIVGGGLLGVWSFLVLSE